MQEMPHWSPQRAPHDPGAPISALYPGLRSARQDVFPHSTGLEVQRLDHPAQITRPRFRPRTSRQQGPPNDCRSSIQRSQSRGERHHTTTQRAHRYTPVPRKLPSTSTKVLQHLVLARISPTFQQAPYLSFKPLPLSSTNPFRGRLVSPFALDLGASLKPPCGVQNISPATTRSRCPPHLCT